MKKYTSLEKIKYDGVKVRVGDLILYETVTDDGDEDFFTNVHYGVIKSINSYETESNRTEYKFDIKMVDPKSESSKQSNEERFYRIIKVCNSRYFDRLIQGVKEKAEKKIKSLQSQIEQVKPDTEKLIEQYEELKTLLK